MPTPTRTLLLGLVFLCSSTFAQSDPPKLRKLNNRKHQQHQQRVKATLPTANSEATEGVEIRQKKTPFILRIRRNKNRQAHRTVPATETATPLDPRESYEQQRKKRRPLKRKK